MKIDVNKIPPEGLALFEEISPGALDLETDTVKLRSPVKVKAEAFRISNAVTVRLNLHALMKKTCSRCIGEFETELKKDMVLNYPVDNQAPVIDLDADVREEIILDYPIKPLCRVDCKGLCPKCGKNLNEGKCDCKE